MPERTRPVDFYYYTNKFFSYVVETLTLLIWNQFWSYLKMSFMK